MLQIKAKAKVIYEIRLGLSRKNIDNDVTILKFYLAWYPRGSHPIQPFSGALHPSIPLPSLPSVPLKSLPLSADYYNLHCIDKPIRRTWIITSLWSSTLVKNPHALSILSRSSQSWFSVVLCCLFVLDSSLKRWTYFKMFASLNSLEDSTFYRLILQ